MNDNLRAHCQLVLLGKNDESSKDKSTPRQIRKFLETQKIGSKIAVRHVANLIRLFAFNNGFFDLQEHLYAGTTPRADKKHNRPGILRVLLTNTLKNVFSEKVKFVQGSIKEFLLFDENIKGITDRFTSHIEVDDEKRLQLINSFQGPYKTVVEEIMRQAMLSERVYQAAFVREVEEVSYKGETFKEKVDAYIDLYAPPGSLKALRSINWKDDRLRWDSIAKVLFEEDSLEKGLFIPKFRSGKNTSVAQEVTRSASVIGAVHYKIIEIVRGNTAKLLDEHLYEERENLLKILEILANSETERYVFTRYVKDGEVYERSDIREKDTVIFTKMVNTGSKSGNLSAKMPSDFIQVLKKDLAKQTLQLIEGSMRNLQGSAFPSDENGNFTIVTDGVVLSNEAQIAIEILLQRMKNNKDADGIHLENGGTDMEGYLSEKMPTISTIYNTLWHAFNEQIPKLPQVLPLYLMPTAHMFPWLVPKAFVDTKNVRENSRAVNAYIEHARSGSSKKSKTKRDDLYKSYVSRIKRIEKEQNKKKGAVSANKDRSILFKQIDTVAEKRIQFARNRLHRALDRSKEWFEKILEENNLGPFYTGEYPIQTSFELLLLGINRLEKTTKIKTKNKPGDDLINSLRKLFKTDMLPQHFNAVPNGIKDIPLHALTEIKNMSCGFQNTSTVHTAEVVFPSSKTNIGDDKELLRIQAKLEKPIPKNKGTKKVLDTNELNYLLTFKTSDSPSLANIRYFSLLLQHGKTLEVYESLIKKILIDKPGQQALASLNDFVTTSKNYLINNDNDSQQQREGNVDIGFVLLDHIIKGIKIVNEAGIMFSPEQKQQFFTNAIDFLIQLNRQDPSLKHNNKVMNIGGEVIAGIYSEGEGLSEAINQLDKTFKQAVLGESDYIMGQSYKFLASLLGIMADIQVAKIFKGKDVNIPEVSATLRLSIQDMLIKIEQYKLLESLAISPLPKNESTIPEAKQEVIGLIDNVFERNTFDEIRQWMAKMTLKALCNETMAMAIDENANKIKDSHPLKMLPSIMDKVMTYLENDLNKIDKHYYLFLLNGLSNSALAIAKYEAETGDTSLRTTLLNTFNRQNQRFNMLFPEPLDGYTREYKLATWILTGEGETENTNEGILPVVDETIAFKKFINQVLSTMKSTASACDGRVTLAKQAMKKYQNEHP